MGDGKTSATTDKAFELILCGLGHSKHGTMDEEYLFWDNHWDDQSVTQQTRTRAVTTKEALQ